MSSAHTVHGDSTSKLQSVTSTSAKNSLSESTVAHLPMPQLRPSKPLAYSTRPPSPRRGQHQQLAALQEVAPTSASLALPPGAQQGPPGQVLECQPQEDEQAATRAGARALSNYSKNAAAAAAAAAPAYEYDVNLRCTATISTTSSPICTPVTAEGGGHHRSFAYNPHPKLSDIRHRGTGRDTSTGDAGQHAHFIGTLSGEADRYCNPAAVLSTREALFGNTSRREPAYADDFCINSREQSPDYDENSYRNTREYHYSSQPRERNKNQSGRRQGQSHLTSAGTQSTPWPKFCHECGSWYPVATAKFCCDCGTRRLTLPREGI